MRDNLNRLASDLIDGNETILLKAIVVSCNAKDKIINHNTYMISFNKFICYLSNGMDRYYAIPYYIHNYKNDGDFELCFDFGVSYKVISQIHKTILTPSGYTEPDYYSDNIILSIEIQG